LLIEIFRQLFQNGLSYQFDACLLFGTDRNRLASKSLLYPDGKGCGVLPYICLVDEQNGRDVFCLKLFQPMKFFGEVRFSGFFSRATTCTKQKGDIGFLYGFPRAFDTPVS